MHELRVKPQEFKSLFDENTDPKDREKIYKRLKLMCIDYPVLAERVNRLEEKLAVAQIKAGKYNTIERTLKLNNTK